MRSKISAGACTTLGAVVIAGLLASSGCSRETQTPVAPAAPAPAVAEPVEAPSAEVRVASDDTKAMVAPIALYPDPILELVLQGAAQPGQVVLAVRFLDAHAKNASLAPDAAWDTAVIGLLNYPRVLGMMNDSLDWTTDLGESAASDLEGVQLAVQELRWSAYNTGILTSNEWQDVIVNGGVVAILPAKRDQLSIPEYDGAALLEAATPAAEAAPPPEGGFAPAPAQAPASAVAYASAPAAVPVSYGAPQSSFWSNAAIFAGGAALGGLVGYWIGDDDDDDDHHHGRGWNRWDDDWDRRPWRGGHNKIKIDGDVIINPARPGVGLRPNRPITRPAVVGGGRPGRPGRSVLPAPVVGKNKVPGRRPAARPATRPTRPVGIAPARPDVRPARPGREVKMPRPAEAKARPAPARRDVARVERPLAKPARAPEHRAGLSPDRSNPQVQRDRARGHASRQHAKATRPQPSLKPATRARPERSAFDRKSRGGGKHASKAAQRGKQSRGRRG